MARMIAATRFHGCAMTIERTDRLTSKQKIYIVERLAIYDDLTEIAFGLKTQFRVDMMPRSVAQYLPGMPRGKRLSQALKALFWQIRRSYVLTHDKVYALDMPARLLLQRRAANEAGAARRHEIADEIEDAISEECKAYAREFRRDPYGRGLVKFH
jgi:hypothetical protein